MSSVLVSTSSTDKIFLLIEKKRNRMDIISILIAFVAFALAALRWGANGTDGIDSTEWERRQCWYGSFHNYKEDV